MGLIRVLEVWWEDAMSHDAWADEGETAEFCASPCKAVTVGLEVLSTDDAITVAAAMNTNQIGGIWRIPRKMVKRVRVLGRIKPPSE